MAPTTAPRKTPSYLLDENWSKRIPNPAEPECIEWTYVLWGSEYTGREEIEGSILVTVDDFGAYTLTYTYQYAYETFTVPNWAGDQGTFDKVRKAVAAGVRRAVTETNNGGRSQRASDWGEWGADWRTWRRGR